MNAVTTSNHKTHTFKWLLKREVWENRGGFGWAPVITGAIFLVMTILGLVIASALFWKARNESGINLSTDLEPGHAQAMGFAGDLSLVVGIGLAMAVMAFVVFFYCLGSLYDERRDRSVLFWKSMPVSDTQTVLSKLAWALLLAPVIAILVGVAIGAALWLVSLLAAAINGLPSAGAVVTESHPLRVLGNILVIVPVYALWALPTVGWLMLCSAWARRFPFLWAVLIPFLTCAMVSLVALITGAATGMKFPFASLWYTVWYRGVMSIAPGTWYALPQVREQVKPITVNGPEDLAKAIDMSQSWHAFLTLDLWLGVAFGVACIVGAIYLRRWRELAD